MNARGLSAKRGKLLLDFGLGFIIEGGEAAVRSLFQLFDGGLGIALFQIVARQEPERIDLRFLIFMRLGEILQRLFLSPSRR